MDHGLLCDKSLPLLTCIKPVKLFLFPLVLFRLLLLCLLILDSLDIFLVFSISGFKAYWKDKPRPQLLAEWNASTGWTIQEATLALTGIPCTAAQLRKELA